MLTRTILCGIAIATSLLVGTFPARAAKQPRPLISDYRVKQVAYDANQVYEIVGNYGYQTLLEFSADEQIKVVALGDTIAWQTVPFQNRLFLKPVEPNAATNLTVITTKHTYYFKLSSSKNPSAMTFLVRFVYANSNGQFTMTGWERKGSKALDTARINLAYGVAGDKAKMGLKHVFDDGQFTYFMFDENAEIPSFYVVAADGSESLVNWRREGAYMVVERLGDRFTLRNG